MCSFNKKLVQHLKFNKLTMNILVFLVTVFFISNVNTEDCDQEEWAQCARPLELLSTTSELSFVTKKEELDQLCPDLHRGLKCIRSYTRRCMNIHQREHFNKLYRGTSQVIEELCQEGAYQEDFLRHAPCMRYVKREYEICSNRYQETITKIGQTASQSRGKFNITQMVKEEEERRREMCCSFTEYIECSERVVRHVCGLDTANFTRKFLDKMSSSIISMHCEDYRNKTGKCGDIVNNGVNSFNFISNTFYIFNALSFSFLYILILNKIF